jgi:predicted MFS family arabinose efflux permease
MSVSAIPTSIAPASLWGRAGRLFVIFMGPSLGGLAPLALSTDQIALAAHFGGDDGTLIARLLFSMPSLTIMLGAPLAGFLAERIGYRALLLASSLIYGIAGTAGLYIDGYWPLLISRAVLGFAAGGMMAMYMALAATYYEGDARARVIGFAVACSVMFGLLALLLGGILVDRFGWRGPFVLYLIGFVTFVIAWATIRGRIHVAGQSGSRVSVAETFRVIKRLWPVYLVLLTYSIGTFTPTAGGPFLLKANGIDSAANQGLLLAVGAIPAFVTGSSYGYLSRRFGDYALLIVTGLLMGAGVILLLLFHGQLPIVATLVLINFGAGLKAPAVGTILMAEATEKTRGTVAGLNSSGIFLAQFLAPMLLEFLGRPYGMKGAFLVIAAALLAAASFVAWRGIGKKRLVVGAA